MQSWTGIRLPMLLLGLALIVLVMPAAAGAQVNTELDHTNDGCEQSPGDCTLREAIQGSR